jgi:hypothetical protein
MYINLPKRSSALLAVSSVSSTLETSIPTAIASPPLDWISLTVTSAASKLISATTILALQQPFPDQKRAPVRKPHGYDCHFIL